MQCDLNWCFCGKQTADAISNYCSKACQNKETAAANAISFDTKTLFGLGFACSSKAMPSSPNTYKQQQQLQQQQRSQVKRPCLDIETPPGSPEMRNMTVAAEVPVLFLSEEEIYAQLAFHSRAKRS
ncbi:hypothetical protein HDU98_005423, partial [Podochytrium sp. JEL0797]